MAQIGDFYQAADWKQEKHAPVIDAPDSVSAGDKFVIKAEIGKEIAHPNTTEHHIRWIKLYFKPTEDKFIYELGSYNFNAHGEAVKGANEGPCYTEPQLSTTISLKQSGTLYATSYCNIHGLWESSKEIKVS